METRSVFIIGVGRSGTNLLSQVLDGSPEVNFPLEQKVVLKTYRKLTARPLTTERKNYFKNILKNDIFLNNVWKLNWDGLFKAIDDLPENTPYHKLCNTILDHRESLYSDKKNVKIYGYHNPRCTPHSENLMKAFPGCKFIFLYRNPLDNVSSYKKSKFFKGLISIPFFAYRWKWYNAYCLRFREKFPERVFSLGYEDFVREPEKKTEELCKFLDITYDRRMLGFEEKFTGFYKENMIKDMYHVHEKMTDKINTKNIEAYRSTLTEDEIEYTRAVTANTAKALNYELFPVKGKLKYKLGFFTAARYLYIFDYYCFLQMILNKIFPGKMIRL